jgi:thiamine biosynthesis protein ThiI
MFNYSNPEKTIYIEIADKIYIYTKRHEGFGGLPVGTGGKVLCLLSGGIDSPVAAWLMMKRGCQVDFLHFHAFPKNRLAKEGKIIETVNILNNYQFESKIFLVPYSEYVLKTQGKIFEEYDLVIFKHYMTRLADKIAQEKKYGAIVNGDNLAQVASQTLENLKAASQKIESPIFRPLIGYDKEEIIGLSKKIGTHDISLERYKDCCSIISKKPSTKTKIKNFERELGKINLDRIISESMKGLDLIKVS